MPLDPYTQSLLDQAAAQSLPEDPQVLLAALRASTNPQVIKQARQALGSETVPVARVEDLTLPGPVGDIPARLYTPEGMGPFPVLVFFHGGGWVAGNLETHDPMCRYLCREAGCLVLSVDYRLAPEHKFPAGLQDCYAATCWVAAHAAEFHGDSTRLAVGGDSGGGNFAVVVAQMVRDQGGPTLAFQLLLWPIADFQLTTPSWQAYDGYMMTRQGFIMARDLYLNHEDEQWQPYTAPLLAPDLHGLPPALIITAECDPVRDGGEQYGQRLLAAGVPASVARNAGMIHGFMHYVIALPQARQALAEVSHALHTVFAK